MTDIKTIDIDEQFSVDNVLEGNKSSGIIDRIHRWAQARSLWVYYIGNSCCHLNYEKAIEGKNPLANSHRLMRTYSPLQADLLIIAGPITAKLVTEVKKVYEQMPSPKWVMAIGVCSCSGGLFEGYNVCSDLSALIPIDVYVPGCPPSTKAIIEAFDLIREKIKKCGVKDH